MRIGLDLRRVTVAAGQPRCATRELNRHGRADPTQRRNPGLLGNRGPGRINRVYEPLDSKPMRGRAATGIPSSTRSILEIIPINASNSAMQTESNHKEDILHSASPLSLRKGKFSVNSYRLETFSVAVWPLYFDRFHHLNRTKSESERAGWLLLR